MPECERLITADADGQHTYPDIQKVIEKSIECPGALVLGSREFDGDVPFRSKFGNSFSTVLQTPNISETSICTAHQFGSHNVWHH